MKEPLVFGGNEHDVTLGFMLRSGGAMTYPATLGDFTQCLFDSFGRGMCCTECI